MRTTKEIHKDINFYEPKYLHIKKLGHKSEADKLKVKIDGLYEELWTITENIKNCPICDGKIEKFALERYKCNKCGAAMKIHIM